MKIDRVGFFSRVQVAMAESSAPAIARRLGITKQSVYAWEKKGVIPEADVLAAIAGENRISLHWLLTGEGEKSVSRSNVLAMPKPVDEFVPEGMSDAEISGLKALAHREGRTPGNMIAVLIRRELQQTNFTEDDAVQPGPVIASVEDLLEQLDKLPKSQRRATTAQMLGELLIRANQK